MSVAAGTEIAPFTIVVTPDAMKVWARILRDPNPIHLDPAAVRANGLGDRVINQGPSNMAFIVNALANAFPGAAIRSLDMRLIDNVYGGETVEAGGTVTAVDREGAADIIRCEVWLKAIGRGPVITGSATVALPA